MVRINENEGEKLLKSLKESWDKLKEKLLKDLKESWDKLNKTNKFSKNTWINLILKETDY